MGTIATNTFTSFDLTEEERRSAVILTTLQRQNIHNLISVTAESVIGLVFDGTNPIKFAQDDAFLKGQLQILQHLLDLSDAAEFEIAAEMRERNSEGGGERY